MADKTILIELNVEGQNALIEVDKLQESLKTLEKGTDDYKQALKELAIQEGIVLRSQKARDKAQKEASNGMKQVKTDTGAATSATLELGRVFSDMPYGIRGVANNLQQLAANLFFMSKKTDGVTGKMKGFKGAIGSLLKNLIGPAGMLVAFQAIIAAFDYFSDGAKKSEDSTKDLTKELETQISVLKGYTNALDNSNLSLDDRANFVKAATFSDKEFLDLMKNTNLTIAEQEVALRDLSARKQKDLGIHRERVKLEAANEIIRKAENISLGEINDKIEKQKNLLQISLLAIGGLESGGFDVYTKKIEELENITKAYEDQAAAIKKIQELASGEVKEEDIIEKKSLADYKAKLSRFKKLRENASRTRVEYNALTAGITALEKEIARIEGIKKKAGKSKKLSFFKTPKELDIDVKNNEKALLDFQKKIEAAEIKTQLNNSLSTAKTEEERFNIKKLYAIKELTAQIEYEKKILELKQDTEKAIAKSKAESHSADLRKAYELYALKIDLDKDLTEEQKKQLKGDATGKLVDALSQAEKEANTAEKSIKDKYTKIFEVFKDLKQARFEALFSGFKDKDKEKEETDLEKWARYAENAKAIISSVSDFVDSEFDRQMAVEQNKTNALNNELNKRLLDENLSKEQKKAIQLEIAQNDEKLRVKQEKIARKRFNVMKAFSLATALADTYLATQKAYTSQLQLDPTSPIRAKIAAGVALAAGLANVAAIARTKFESSSGSSPAIGGGGGSGGVSSRAEPSFNIVGRSNDNLLLNAIQSQFDQPLRAYVVARDVTNQQQMDGIITGAAGT